MKSSVRNVIKVKDGKFIWEYKNSKMLMTRLKEEIIDSPLKDINSKVFVYT